MGVMRCPLLPNQICFRACYLHLLRISTNQKIKLIHSSLIGKWRTGYRTKLSSSHCAIYTKLYPDLSNTVVTIATLSSLDLGPYIRCGLSGVWCPPWCRVTRAGSLTAESRRRARLSQHFSSVVLLSAGHSTIINHKLLFHGNLAILLLQNHCHHDHSSYQQPWAKLLYLCHPPMWLWHLIYFYYFAYIASISFLTFSTVLGGTRQTILLRPPNPGECFFCSKSGSKNELNQWILLADLIFASMEIVLGCYSPSCT